MLDKILLKSTTVVSTILILFSFLSLPQNTEAKLTLTIAGRDGSYGEAMQLAVDTYMAENPNIEIELLKLPYAGLYEKIVIDMKEAMGAYDIVLADDPWITGFATVGWLANLSEIFMEKKVSLDPDFIDVVVDGSRYPYVPGIASIYGLPYVGTSEVFAYRKDLFNKYGLPSPPETWDDVLEAARIIDENEPEVHGVVFRGIKGDPILVGFLPIFWAFGANVFDEEGNPTINSPEALAALKFFLKLAEYAPKDVAVYDASDVRGALMSGAAAIAPEVWPAWVPDLDNPEKSQVVGKIEISVHPGQVTRPAPMLGVWYITIPEASTRKEAAFDFLLFVTSERMQRKLAMGFGTPPARESIYMDPELVAKYRSYPTQLEAIIASKPRPRIPEWLEISPLLGDYINLALVGELTPEEAFNEVNAKIAKIVGK